MSGSVNARTKTYTVTATDAAANRATTPNQSVTVDNTAPVPAVTKVSSATVSFPFTTAANIVGRRCLRLGDR